MIFDTNNYYDDMQVGESPYPLGLEGALMHVYENECNYNAMMKAVGISELRYYKDTGRSLFVHEAGAFSSFIEKAKSFFKKVIEKIKQIFHKFAATLNQYFMKDKDFVKKYEKELKRKNLADFEFEGYKFDHIEAAKSAALGSAFEVYKNATISNTGGKSDRYIDSLGAKDSEYDSTAMDAQRDEAYGIVLADILSSNTAKNVEPDEFRTELHDYLYGDGKETLEKIQIRQQLDYISGTQKDIKDVEKQQRQITKGIEAFIKELDRWANEINKKGATYKSVMNDGETDTLTKDNKLKSSDDEMDSKDQDAATKQIDKEIAGAKELSNAVTIAFGMIVQAVKDRNRQAKAICVKAIGYKHEAAGYYNYSESSVDDLFAGVTIR